MKIKNVFVKEKVTKKLNPSDKNHLKKGVKKLYNILGELNGSLTIYMPNNPAIHDSYGAFYVYKYISKGCSLRILYEIKNDDTLIIHKVYYKKGNNDNKKYIMEFENYRDEKDKEISLEL